MTGRWLEPQITPSPPTSTLVSTRGQLIRVDLWVLIQLINTFLKFLFFLQAFKQFNFISSMWSVCQDLFLYLNSLSCRRQCGSCPTSQQATSSRCRLSLMQSWFPWSSTCSTRCGSFALLFWRRFKIKNKIWCLYWIYSFQGDFGTQKEAAWAISNLTISGRKDQVKYCCSC